MPKIFKKARGASKGSGAAAKADDQPEEASGGDMYLQRGGSSDALVAESTNPKHKAGIKKPRMPSAVELCDALSKETKQSADVTTQFLTALPKVIGKFLKERGTARIQGLCTLSRKVQKARAEQIKVICGRSVALKPKEAMTTIRIVPQPSFKSISE